MALSLYFVQHSRQRYATTVPARAFDDFIVRSEDSAEFMVEIVDLRGISGDSGLEPHLATFDDGLPCLRKFISLGGLKTLGTVEHPDDYARRLLALGLEDHSDKPLTVPA
jgi:hypothetical protein